MSVSGHDRVSPQSERNSESLTTELGEHLTPGFNPAPVLPYSIPVAGGYAYVCGTGHTHGTYGAAERCGAAEPVQKVTLLGPAPYGGSYTSTVDDPTVERLTGEGWTVSRTWTTDRVNHATDLVDDALRVGGLGGLADLIMDGSV